MWIFSQIEIFQYTSYSTEETEPKALKFNQIARMAIKLTTRVEEREQTNISFTRNEDKDKTWWSDLKRFKK